MRIVRAEAEHAGRLSQIARTAKAHWGYPADWMEAWRDLFTIQPETIAAHGYFAAWPEGGQVVGFCGVHRDGADWRLEHLWVLPEWQGQGTGRQLYERAAVFVRERGGSTLLIQADPHAERFYLRRGAVRVGEVDATMFGVARALPELRHVFA